MGRFQEFMQRPGMAEALMGMGHQLSANAQTDPGYGLSSGMAYAQEAILRARQQEEERVRAEAEARAQAERQAQEDAWRQEQRGFQREQRGWARDDRALGEEQREQAMAQQQLDIKSAQEKTQRAIEWAGDRLGPEVTRDFMVMMENSGPDKAIQWASKQLKPEEKDYILREFNGSLLRFDKETGELNVAMPGEPEAEEPEGPDSSEYMRAMSKAMQMIPEHDRDPATVKKMTEGILASSRGESPPVDAGGYGTDYRALEAAGIRATSEALEEYRVLLQYGLSEDDAIARLKIKYR